MFKRSVILCAVILIASSEFAVAQSYLYVPGKGKEPLNSPAAKAPKPVNKKSKVPKDQSRIGDEGNWPSVGKVGQIYACRFKVVQVIDAENVLGEITLDERRKIVAITRSGPDAPRHADTVGGPTQSVVWFTMPTKGMVDDSNFNTEEIFTVTGTKQYETASGGTKTIFVLKMRTQEEIHAEQQATAQELQKKKNLAAKKRETEKEQRIKDNTRTWTAASSGKTLRATFIGSIGDKVKLQKEDGTAITVALNQLSDEDQAWIKNRSH